MWHWFLFRFAGHTFLKIPSPYWYCQKKVRSGYIGVKKCHTINSPSYLPFSSDCAPSAVTLNDPCSYLAQELGCPMMFSAEKCSGHTGAGPAEAPEIYIGGGDAARKECVPSEEVASAVAAVSDEIGDILKDELGDAARAERIGAELADLSAELGLLAGLAAHEPQPNFPAFLEPTVSPRKLAIFLPKWLTVHHTCVCIQLHIFWQFSMVVARVFRESWRFACSFRWCFEEHGLVAMPHSCPKCLQCQGIFNRWELEVYRTVLNLRYWRVVCLQTLFYVTKCVQ